MNKCFFIGDIVKNEGFKFIIGKRLKHRSKIILHIKLKNQSIFKAIAYDKTADYILRKDMDCGLVFIIGKLRYNKKTKQVNILIEYIQKL